MGPNVLCTHAKNWEDPLSCFGVNCKELKKHLFWTINPQQIAIQNFFRKTILLKQWAIFSSTHIKELRRSLEPLKSKVQKIKKHLFGHLIPYNPGLRIFQKKQFCSNNRRYCPLNSCKKLDRSLESFKSKVQRGKKTLFWTLNPLLSRIKNFFRKTILLKQWALMSFALMQKIGKILRVF